MQNPDGSNKLPSMNETAKHRMMPPVKAELENHFQMTPAFYTAHEVDQILKRYRRDFDHIADNLRIELEAIISVLQYTKNFLNQTTIDDEEDKSERNDAHINEILNSMCQALLKAVEKLKSKDTNPSLKIYSSAVDYCKKCITNRISELKKVNDKVYVIYQSHQLKEFFEPKKFTPQKK